MLVNQLGSVIEISCACCMFMCELCVRVNCVVFQMGFLYFPFDGYYR